MNRATCQNLDFPGRMSEKGEYGRSLTHKLGLIYTVNFTWPYSPFLLIQINA